MEVQVVGAHNLEIGKDRHTCCVIDGVLGIDAGSLVSALNADAVSRVRTILLTHEHFDHTRDVPMMVLAILDSPQVIEIFGLRGTLESVRRHLMDGELYPDLTTSLNNAPPKCRFVPIVPQLAFQVLDYQAKAISMLHPVPAVGYIVKSSSGGCIAFTGDTGGELMAILQDELAPKLLFVDVTFPNRLESRAKLTGHLTPGLLGQQLSAALQQNVRLPTIVPVHLSAQHEQEIWRDLAAIGSALRITLSPGREGQVFVDGRLQE